MAAGHTDRVTETTSPDAYPATDRTTPTRKRERAVYRRDAVHAVLDEAYLCHVGYVVDGAPVVLPNIHTRVGDALYLHTSTGARLAQTARTAPVPVCVTVTLLDALVLARAYLNHSMGYRSVVVRGEATLVTDDAEISTAMSAIIDHVVPGRSPFVRKPSPRERAQTAILRVPLVEVSLKRRDDVVRDEEADRGLPVWAGTLPVRTVLGEPRPVTDLPDGVPVPEHVAGAGRRPRATDL